MKTKSSNCLFEALKAKIKDPKHIRIIRFPKVLTGHLHFGWTDAANISIILMTLFIIREAA